MANGTDPPIVITGNSVTIEFPETEFPPDPGSKGKFKNENKKISRVEITGAGIENYNKGATGKDITIRVYYD